MNIDDSFKTRLKTKDLAPRPSQICKDRHIKRRYPPKIEPAEWVSEAWAGKKVLCPNSLPILPTSVVILKKNTSTLSFFVVIVFFCSMTLTLDNIARDVCLRYTGNRKRLVLSAGGNDLISAVQGLAYVQVNIFDTV